MAYYTKTCYSCKTPFEYYSGLFTASPSMCSACQNRQAITDALAEQQRSQNQFSGNFDPISIARSRRPYVDPEANVTYEDAQDKGREVARDHFFGTKLTPQYLLGMKGVHMKLLRPKSDGSVGVEWTWGSDFYRTDWLNDAAREAVLEEFNNFTYEQYADWINRYKKALPQALKETQEFRELGKSRIKKVKLLKDTSWTIFWVYIAAMLVFLFGFWSDLTFWESVVTIIGSSINAAIIGFISKTIGEKLDTIDIDFDLTFGNYDWAMDYGNNLLSKT